MTIKCLTFDLDDTLWDVYPVIMKAEKRFHDWLTEHYPLIANDFDMDTMVTHRQHYFTQFEEMRHDFTWLRKKWLSHIAQKYQCPDEFETVGFDVFHKARNEVDLYDVYAIPGLALNVAYLVDTGVLDVVHEDTIVICSASNTTLTEDLGRNEVMIISIDKDYKQFPALIYNYHHKHRIVYDITKQEALFNFYSQMIEGDQADNVNFFKGKGKKFAEKYYKDCTTKYQYTKKLYELFKKEYKSKAKLKYIECYTLLKLRTN